MVAFSIALAASVLFVCIANVCKEYIEYKSKENTDSNYAYRTKLYNIGILCDDITEQENIANDKNEYFSISNYQEVIKKIKYIIKLR